MAPAFIDIIKVEISIAGGVTWREISEDGTIYIKDGTIAQHRVTVKNTGEQRSEFTYIGLYGMDGGLSLKAFNLNYKEQQLEPGATLTSILDWGMCSPQPTFCPVERGHQYQIVTTCTTNKIDDSFYFTIAEPVDITSMLIALLSMLGGAAVALSLMKVS